MKNVPVSIQIVNDNVLIEADFIESKIGFIFKKDENNIDSVDYNILLKEKDFNTIAKIFVFPKLNKKIRNNYGKRFTLDKLHLGEVLYGKMYNIEIISNLNLEIAISNLTNNIDYNKKKNIRHIDEIILNHKLFFYIKDKNINNRIICSGLINY